MNKPPELTGIYMRTLQHLRQGVEKLATDGVISHRAAKLIPEVFAPQLLWHQEQPQIFDVSQLPVSDRVEVLMGFVVATMVAAESLREIKGAHPYTPRIAEAAYGIAACLHSVASNCAIAVVNSGLQDVIDPHHQN